MRLTSEPIDPELLGYHSGKVLPLGVVAPSRLLEVRETRAVLDMQHGCRIAGGREHVRSPSELEVLVRVVDGDRDSGRTQSADLQLAHGRVDEIGALSRPASIRHELER